MAMQYVRIRSRTCKDYAHPPLWKRIIDPQDAHKVRRSYALEIFSSVDDKYLGTVRIDDALWFLTEYNSYPLEQAQVLLHHLHASERPREDLHPTCVASEWTSIDAPIGYSDIYLTFLAKATEANLDPNLYCFGKPQKLQQYVLFYRKGLFGRHLQRPWVVAWHDERAILSARGRFEDERAACEYLLEQVTSESEFRKLYTPKSS